MSEQVGEKEPSYFATDLAVPRRIPRHRFSEQEYLALFDNAPHGSTYLGEASSWYLYSKVAVSELLRVSQGARLIVMVRNPIEMARALHNEYCRSLLEDERDFAAAWRLQDRRLQGEHLPRRFPDPQLLQYGDVCKLGEQLRRLFLVASREQCHVVVYDDFAASPGKSYREVLRFLELGDDGRTEFSLVNTSRIVKRPAIEGALLRVERVRRLLGIPGGLGLHAWINRFNMTPGKSAVPPGLHDELRDYFRTDILLLSQLLDRDLVHWLGESSTRMSLGQAARPE